MATRFEMTYQTEAVNPAAAPCTHGGRQSQDQKDRAHPNKGVRACADDANARTGRKMEGESLLEGALGASKGDA